MRKGKKGKKAKKGKRKKEKQMKNIGKKQTNIHKKPRNRDLRKKKSEMKCE